MRRPGALAFVLRLGFLAALLGLWELAVGWFELPAFIVPAPSRVAMALYRGLQSDVYIAHAYATVVETLLGFALGSVVALVLGSVIAMSRTVEYYFHPLVVMFQALPKVALFPLIVVWFGLGISSKIVSAAIVAFFPLMVNTIVGLRAADEDRINLMRSLAASRWQIFRMLRLPGALPFVFAGLEIAMLLALIGAVIAEMLGADKGLGMLMQSMNFGMDVAGEFSILFLLAVLGLMLNGLINLARRRIVFWDRSRDGELVSPSKGGV